MDAPRLTINTVFFDLDGTFADTAPDLIQALHRLQRDEGHSESEFDRIRPFVSQGSVAMVRKGFPEVKSKQEFERLRLKFLDYYAAEVCQHTVMFPGMQDVLAYLESKCMKWGIVTNKPGWLTEPLIKAMDLQPQPVCVVSGDTTRERKPHPMPLLHACELSGSAPELCVYVGDDPRDIQAGNAANMKTLVAGFGYIDDSEEPESWGAHGIIAQASDLITWLESANTLRA